MIFGSILWVRKGSDSMLTRYLESHEERIEKLLEAHPVLGFTGGMIAAGMAVLGAVSAITILAALPIYAVTCIV